MGSVVLTTGINCQLFICTSPNSVILRGYRLVAAYAGGVSIKFRSESSFLEDVRGFTQSLYFRCLRYCQKIDSSLSLPCCSCSLLFACSYWAVSQICGVNPRIKTHDSIPSLDRSIKIVWRLKQVFKTYRMVFKYLKGKKEVACTLFLQRKEKH
jgi:hypothetical protein